MLADKLPTQFLLPGFDLKMVLEYDSVSVSPEVGIVFQVAQRIVPREPKVRLSSSEVHVPDESTHATATVHAELEDFRGPKVTWSHPGGKLVAADEQHLVVTYPIPQPAPKAAGHTVTATATYADQKGKKFHGKREVRIVVDKTRPGDGEGPHPPHTE
jgi:hypothetical protein